MDSNCTTYGAFSWCELLTNDVEGAKDFYRNLFGWALEPAQACEEYSIVKCGDQPVGGIMAIPAAAKGMPPTWGVYVTVQDVDATARRATEMGGRICVPPQDIPQVGRFCVLQDPQGAAFNIISYLPQIHEEPK